MKEKPETVIKHLPATVAKMLKGSDNLLSDLTTMMRDGVIISVGMEPDGFATYLRLLERRGIITIISRDDRSYYTAL